MQFQAAFVVDIPYKLLAGANHDLTVLVRVTANGREPVYLGMSGAIRTIEAGKGDVELKGSFAIGEGVYRVEALLEDETQRVCYSQWGAVAALGAGERNLQPPIPAGEVREAGSSGPPLPVAKAKSQIERLTILVHATSMKPGAAQMEDQTVTDLTGALESLLTQMPARSVHLVIFNLDRQLVLLNKDPFRRADLPEAIRAFERLELAVVDAKALASRDKRDVLSDLLLQEQGRPQTSSAVIVLGPHTFQPTDPMISTELHRGSTLWFYLQYLPWSAAIPLLRESPAPPVDGIHGLMRGVQGETIPIGSAHDLATAIDRMAAEIPKRNLSGEPTTPEITPPFDGDGAELADLNDGEDPVALLATMRDRVLARVDSVPNHTCVETVKRDSYQAQGGLRSRSCDSVLAERKLRNHRLILGTTDWLRLDVGMSKDREMFSWPGAAAFEKEEFDRWLPEGAFGTGLFASMLLSVLQSREPHFVLDGATVLDGRRLVQYSFRAAKEESHYRVKSRSGDWLLTGYDGALLVDPATSQLVRFRLRTVELPADTDNCQIDTTLDYNMVEMGQFEYLLPTSSRQRFVAIDGAESENTVSFASCREFRGESTLLFNDRVAGDADAGKSTRVSLPGGLSLSVELTTPFTLGKAAVGDPIEGLLAEPLRDARTQKLFAPAGAKLTGRLTRAELRYGREPEYSVALRWETLELNGAKTPLNLAPKQPVVSMEADGRRVLQRRGAKIELPRQVREREVLYLFPALPGAEESGLRTEWLTLSAQ